jgi:Amidohydrolase family
MKSRPVDELLGAAVERPVLEQFQIEVGRTLEDRVQPGLPGDDGKSVTCTRSTSPAAISARFNDRLPCERNGTSDSSLSRATTSTASPRTTVASGQSRGSSSVDDTTVAGIFHIRVTHGSRTSESSVLSASIPTKARNVFAPKTIRWFAWTPHGTYARDLQHFVELLGFTPMEAIISATAWGGEIMLRRDELGKVQPGYLADLLLVDGDPLADITILQDHDALHYIMKDGKFH